MEPSRFLLPFPSAAISHVRTKIWPTLRPHSLEQEQRGNFVSKLPPTKKTCRAPLTTGQRRDKTVPKQPAAHGLEGQAGSTASETEHPKLTESAAAATTRACLRLPGQQRLHQVAPDNERAACCGQLCRVRCSVHGKPNRLAQLHRGLN